MKNPIQIVLVLLTIASLGFGYYKSNQAFKYKEEANQAAGRLASAQAELKRQEAIANDQRKAAEMAAMEARAAMIRAEQQVAECQKRLKK